MFYALVCNPSVSGELLDFEMKVLADKGQFGHSLKTVFRRFARISIHMKIASATVCIFLVS